MGTLGMSWQPEIRVACSDTFPMAMAEYVPRTLLDAVVM